MIFQAVGQDWTDRDFEWEITRCRNEIASIETHIKELQRSAARMREDRLKRAQGMS
jgi:hypothetical protein